MVDDEKWMNVSSTDLADGVRKRLGPSSQLSVDTCVSGLKHLSVSLQSEFRTYWNDKPYNKDISVENHSLHELIEDRDMTVIGAFLALDWLLKDPVTAKASLERGYDTFSFGPRSDEDRARIEARKVQLARDNLI